MKLIQPHCRNRFEARDIDFVVSVLGETREQCLVELLADPECRDNLLDDPALFRALLEQGGCLRVSCRFYFYVLVRQVFLRSGLRDREVADYVAEMLTEFSRTEATRGQMAGQPVSLEYFFELIAALSGADERQTFLLRLHTGNYALFLAGVFPERIRHRAEMRGFPDVSYYESIGRSSYQMASGHPLADRYELSRLLGELAESFPSTRLALNDISDRLFSMGENDFLLDRLLMGISKN